MKSSLPVKRLKLLLVGLMTAVAVALAGGVALKRWVLEKPEVLLTALDDKAQLALQKIHQTASRGGITEWSLEADSARYLDESKELLLENLAVEFFMDDGARMLLTADRGTLRTDTNDIAVRENVRVTKEDLALSTEALDYDHQKRILTSRTEVRITSGGSEITANTLRYDLNTRQAFLDGDVRGVFSENDPPQ
ncbi:MAG TPA: LPS export ABC transporter periplasmic protein LptC [Desulfobacterales bacterium]|nr:LPS export ABC transporter periplasmic protein LptC [Desulfobacterales bacterium]